mgnify:CR=1 FL=1
MKSRDEIVITTEVREFLLDIGDHLAITNEEAVELTVNNDVGVEYNIICWFNGYPKPIQVELEPDNRDMYDDE